MNGECIDFVQYNGPAQLTLEDGTVIHGHAIIAERRVNYDGFQECMYETITFKIIRQIASHPTT